MATIAPVALDLVDPSGLDTKTGFTSTVSHPTSRQLYDPKVAFEEYHYYAQKTRQEENEGSQNSKTKGLLSVMLSGEVRENPITEKTDKATPHESESHAVITDDEWINASRAVRLASAGAAFYLITTDIIGPYGLPYAFATTGYGPGVALYTIFGFLAGVSGYYLWECFMGLDSHQYPIKHFGDIGFRLYGQWCRHLFNVLQSLQLLCVVGLIMIMNGQSLSEITQFKLCYAVCCLVFVLIGFVLGQVRTLPRLGWLANATVWINVVTVCLTMGVAAHSTPLFSAYTASAGYSVNPSLVSPDENGNFPPIQHAAGLPDASNFGASINGLMQAVYAYSGCMIFPEFMAEMKRPRDFLKAMWGAQLFIYVVYMLYGLYFYAFQGQYVQNPAYLGLTPYKWQTVGNALGMTSAQIAGALYSNIGIKVFYNNVAVEIFKAPPLTEKRGKWLWFALAPVYWAMAFVIAGAIPAFSGFTAVVAACGGLQFTYVFPPFLHLAYSINKNALQPGEGFDPASGRVILHDGGFKRIMRGFWRGRWYINIWNVVYFFGALVTAGMGMWAAIENMILIYSVPELNAFGCASPLNVG